MIYKYILLPVFFLFFLSHFNMLSQKINKKSRYNKTHKGILQYNKQQNSIYKQKFEQGNNLRYQFGAKSGFNDRLKSNHNKHIETNDSAYVYDWDATGMDWILYGRLYYYLTEFSTEILQDKYDQDSKTFLKYKKIQSGYDIDGYVEQDFVWDKESSEWLTTYYDNYDVNEMNTEYYEKTWNDTIQKFTNGFRFVYTYVNDTNLVEELGQVWESVEMKWKNKLHMKYTYNGDGFQINSLYKQWDKETGDWQNVEGTSFQYDEYNNLTRFTFQEWDSIQTHWVNVSLYEAEYDETGLFIDTEKTSKWNDDINSWVFLNQTIYKYNDNFLVEKMQIQTWDQTLKQWADSLLISSSYNSNGTLTEYTEQLWKDGTWVDSYRDIYSLNEYDEVTQVDSDIYDESKGEWIGYAREINEIDDLGYLNKQTVEYYNPETKEWETGVYYSYFDNKEIEYTLYWDDDDYSFIDGERYETLLDDNYYPLEEILQLWDSENENWVNSQKTSYYLHSLSGIEKNNISKSQKLRIYPNPNNGSFTIQNLLKNGEPFSYKIFNAMGKLIYSKDNIQIGDKIYNNLNLSQGIYFLQMQSGNNSVVQKFIVR